LYCVEIVNEANIMQTGQVDDIVIFYPGCMNLDVLIFPGDADFQEVQKVLTKLL
jgi:hypothetical protein